MEVKIFLLLNSIINLTMEEYIPFGVLQFKYKFNKHWALAAIVLMDTILVLPRTLGDAGPSLLNTVLTCTHPVIWCCILFKDPLWKRVVVPLGVTFLVMFPLEFVTMGLMHLFWGGSFFQDVYERNEVYFSGLTLINMLYYITVLLVIIFWRRFIDKKKGLKVNIYWLAIFNQTMLMAFWFRIAENYSFQVMWIGFSLDVFGIVIDLLLLYFFNQMEKQLETEEELAALYRQRDFDKEYHQASLQQLNQMKHLHNEFTRHISELHEEVKSSDDIANVKQFLQQSQLEIYAAKQVVYSRHPVINALLSVKQQIARDKNIQMEIHCTHSADIGIADIDICSVLGNLLDNAIEACEKLEQDERSIVVDIDEKAGFFIVKITNSVTARTLEFKKIGYTSKKDSTNHGLGLRMVERICAKYEGSFELTPSEDTMRVCAILKKNSC